MKIFSAIKAVLNRQHKLLKIPRIPWLSEWEMEFENYYVDLKLSNKIGKETRDLQIDEIFDTCKPVKKDIAPRILIEGPAGYGKSTLACKLCFDHAQEKIYMQDFEAVILLCLRDFDETTSETALEALIINTLELKDYKPEKVFETIKKIQRKMLIILDGFDELHPDKHGHVTPLFKGSQLPQVTVIVTSRLENVLLRNEKDEFANNLLQWMDSRILIEGITENNRKLFLELFLDTYSSDEDDLSRKVNFLLNQIGEIESKLRPDKTGILFNCPLFLLLFVIIENEDRDIDSIKTKTGLYKKVFNFLLRRMYTKIGQTKQPYDYFDFDDTNHPDHVLMLCQFGAFAGEAMHKRKYVFDRKDLRDMRPNSEDILKLGILTQTDSKKGHIRRTCYEPLHLSFFEFAVAYYIWVILVHTPKWLSFFHLERISYMLLSLSRSSNITPFVLGLCGKQLPKLCSALMRKRENWLEAIVKHSYKNEMNEESHLDKSELAEAVLPLFPNEYIVYTKRPEIPFFLEEVLAQAQRTGRSKLIIKDNRFVVSNEEVASLPLNVSLVDSVNELTHETEGKPANDSESKPSHESEDTLSDYKMKDCSKFIAKQNIRINPFSFERCRFTFTVCNASLTEQLNWLSNWLVFEGIGLDKPIHKITYWCSESQLTVALRNISQLISEEKVLSFQFSMKMRRYNPPIEEWKEFFRFANQSKQLLDIEIKAEYSSPLTVDLDGKEGKRWRKIELSGSFALCVQGCFHDLTKLEPKSFAAELLSHVDTLRIRTLDLCQLFVLVQNNDSPVDQNLRELRVTFSSETQILQQLFNCGYLKNLQVLAIGLTKTNEWDATITSILSVISYCSQMRLELWEGWTEKFIQTFLRRLRTENFPSVSERGQSSKGTFHLDTLMLSPVNSPENKTPESATVNLIKELLLSGSLRQLWITCTEFKKGYAKQEFIEELFSTKEGFIFEFDEKSIEDCAVWDWGRPNNKAHPIFIFQISVEKAK